MKDITGSVIGIVAEYTPLHNGHSLHMSAALSRCPGAPCVVVLSPHFTQRGEPALADKWLRARMALACGADLVLELPFLFAASAAPFFSVGAVDLLARTRLADHIAFGMEDADKNVNPILNILIHEPPSFKQSLQNELKLGASWPKAASLALEAEIPGGGAFLSSPNNLLALSYMRRIQERGYALTPLPVPRRGSAHGDTTLGPLSSGTAIRRALQEGAPLTEDGTLAAALPAPSLALLREAEAEGRLCVSGQGLWPMLQALLIRSTPEDLRRFDGMEEGLEHLFLKHRACASGLEDLLGQCVSARCTRSRLRRAALRLLVGVDRWSWQAAARLGPPYARVLGANDTGRALLRSRARTSELPFITRLAAARGPLGRFAAEMEFRASALYEALLPGGDARREERARPAMV